jgi:cytosine/adenosine deaminase-related metal-dependent hydrolase
MFRERHTVTMAEVSFKIMLLKNGTVLIHDAEGNVVPSKKDLLISDRKIAKIGTDLEASDEMEVIDCTDKIISPGFVDTHHHGWQTQLKGRHANESLLEYMVTGEFDISGNLRYALLILDISR